MEQHEQFTKWVVEHETAGMPAREAKEFLEAAHLVWPRIMAHTRRELAHQQLSPREITSFAMEIWELSVRSICKTLIRHTNRGPEIADLQHYLIGTFHRRLNRHLRKKRLNDAVLHFLPPDDISELPSDRNVDNGYSARIHKRIQLAKAYEMMDECVKGAVIARLYGYSWSEIAKISKMKEQNLIMRVQYAFRKIRGLTDRYSKQLEIESSIACENGTVRRQK